MRCHCVPSGPFHFYSGNKQIQSGIDFFFLLASTQYKSSFMNISVPSPVFRGKHYDEQSETLQSVNKGMRFASGTIKSASLIL